MDPRLPYALGALASMVRADAANEAASGSPDGTVSDMMRSALTVANQLRRGPGSVYAIRSGQWSAPAGSARDRLLCAIPIGIAMSTIDPEALAETVWVACGCTNRNEFQSAALLAAAVSLLINNRENSPITLCDAVDVVSAMKPRGERQEGPDVLTATRRALNVAANSHSPLVRVRTGTLMVKLADISPSHRIIPLAFFRALYLWAKELPPAFREESGDPALYDAVSAALAGVCDTHSALRDLDVIPVAGVSHIDVLGIADQLLTLSAHTPLEWIRRAAGLAPDRPPRSGPSSFEEPDSDLLNRHAPFEAESAPTPLGAARGDAPAGRVVFMTELLLRFDGHSEDDVPTENEWATREDVHLALPFTAMCAARAMGVEVVSLSPIGQGPRASIIAEALAREGVVDAGPRVEGCDNGFLSPPVKQYGASISSVMTDMPEDAWDEAIRTLGPSDVLYVDGGIEFESKAVLAACEHALAYLPDHVRVVLDASHGLVRQRSLPTDNVLIMVGYDSAESLCRSVSYERPSGDCTDNPRHGAYKVRSDFHQYALNRGQTHESYLARAVHEKYSSDGEVTRFPAPTVVSTDLRGALHTSMGVLAAGFALGYTLERCILLANCAGALASTMPGAASCPTREEIEAAADTLTDRGDDYMRRRNRVYGALAGVAVADAVALPVRGMSPEEITKLYNRRDQLVDADAAHPTMPGAPAGTITQITREVLAAASRLLGEAPSDPTDEARAEDGDWLAGSRYILRAIPVGLVTLTTDPEVFADAVWRACGSDDLTCQEFQAAALVAATVSLGLDWKFDWGNNERSLLRAACEVVATLPPRGIQVPGADVLAETRRAISLIKTFAKDTFEQLRHHVGTSVDPAQSVPAACAISVQFSNRFSAFQSVALGGEAGIISAIAGSIIGALYGVTSFSTHSLAAIEKVSHPDLAPLADRLTDLRLGDLTSSNATGEAAADTLEASTDGE